jgi:hypothetical protein
LYARASTLAAVAGVIFTCFGAFANVAIGAAPTIDNEWVTNVTSTNATLNAEINPNGLETVYKLQIDTTGHFKFFQSDSCVLHPPGIACLQVVIAGEPLAPGLVEPPESSLPASSESQHVSVEMASIGATLIPGETYHYRAITANGNGTAYGENLTFIASSGTGLPWVASESVTLAPYNATLEADINPGGFKTQYQFHLVYGCGVSPGQVCSQACVEGEPCPGPANGPVEVPLPVGSLPASVKVQHVSLDLNEVGVTLKQYKYRFSVEATNNAGSAEGSDQFFDPILSPFSLDLAVGTEEGEGSIVSSPGGIECGATCSAGFEASTEVTLTASPAPGYAFKGWRHCDKGGVNGRQCTVTMSSAKEVGARFVKTWNLLSSKAGNGMGKVQTSPGGIACLDNCTQAEAAFKEGIVTVKQAPAKHNHFVQWLGGCEGSAEICLLGMDEDHEVEAEFAPNPQYALSLTKEGGGQGSVKTKPAGIVCGFTCNASTASFYDGDAVSVNVKLGKGTTKLTWTSGAGTCTGSTETLESNCTVEMDEVHSLVAKFD